MSTPIAIVVGAGSGLGQATAETLHRAGMTVVGVDRSEAGLQQLPEGIAARSPMPPTPPCRVLWSIELPPRSDRPDILVNTIGAFELGDALSVTAQSLRPVLDVNLGAALWLSQAVAPHIEEKGSGAIVHVSARPGVDPTAGYAAYGLRKATLVHLVRTLDVELAAGHQGQRRHAADRRHGEQQGHVTNRDARRSRRTESRRRGDRLPGRRRRRPGERRGPTDLRLKPGQA